MRVRLQPWVFVPLVAIGIALILFGIDRYQHRFVRSDADMVALLPQQKATVFFVDAAALREGGVWGVVGSSKRTEEPEYQEFVRQTGFDYRNSIESLAGAANDDGVFFVVRGHFDWSRLRQFAIAHGGACSGDFCKAPTSRSGRWASFLAVQPNVMALALSRTPTAARELRPPGHQLPNSMPPHPVWVQISQALLKNPLRLPVPVRIFAIALESADRVVISADAAPAGARAVFYVHLDALCPTVATAEVIRNQLQIQTKMLKLELAREHQEPNPRDLSGLITAGTFEAIDKRVMGTWPVRKELLNAMQ